MKRLAELRDEARRLGPRHRHQILRAPLRAIPFSGSLIDPG